MNRMTHQTHPPFEHDSRETEHDHSGKNSPHSYPLVRESTDEVASLRARLAAAERERDALTKILERSTEQLKAYQGKIG